MRGGRRQGAGRKKNIPNRANAIRERDAKSSGATPSDILLASMRLIWSLAQKTNSEKKKLQYVRVAASIAKDLAPYIHPRLSPVDAKQADAPVRHVIKISGGLPEGSTPENPGGTNYDAVPPEDPRS